IKAMTRNSFKNYSFAAFVFFLSIALSSVFYAYRDYLKDASTLGYLGLFVINFVSSATFFVSSPAFLTVIAGGHLAKKKLDKHKTVRFLEKHFFKHGALIIFIIAIIPNPFFDAVGILAGV